MAELLKAKSGESVSVEIGRALGWGLVLFSIVLAAVLVGSMLTGR